MCTCKHTYLHRHAHTDIRIHTFMHTNMHAACMHAVFYVWMHVCACLCIRFCSFHTCHTCTHTRTHRHITWMFLPRFLRCWHTYVHIYIHRYMHTCLTPAYSYLIFFYGDPTYYLSFIYACVCVYMYTYMCLPDTCMFFSHLFPQLPYILRVLLFAPLTLERFLAACARSVMYVCVYVCLDTSSGFWLHL
jgi:hypothetical protein